MKIGKLRLLFVFIMLLFVTGCSDKDNTENTEDGKVSLEEIRKEAETFSYKGTGIDVSNADIIIPDSQTIYDLTFDLKNDSAENVEERFFEDMERYMNVSEIDKENVLYSIKLGGQNVCIPYDEVTDEEKNITNSTLIYCDGTYSKLLYKTSNMCEMGCNTIPTELTQDTTDYSDYIWGYRGLNLGVYTKTYYIPDDDISGVSYKLYNGEVKLQDAIDYVEEHIKTDYNFAGVPYLDYKVCKVDVRRLDDTTYYYEFKVKTCYEGMAFIKDSELIMSDDNYPLVASYYVSMYEGDSLDFIRASCYSYDNMELGKEYTEYISLEEACRLIDKELTNKSEFEIDSIELSYLTEYCFDPEDETGSKVDYVTCYPVYHFSVKNPGKSGYTVAYFDVKVDTGEILITQY